MDSLGLFICSTRRGTSLYFSTVTVVSKLAEFAVRFLKLLPLWEDACFSYVFINVAFVSFFVTKYYSVDSESLETTADCVFDSLISKWNNN